MRSVKPEVRILGVDDAAFRFGQDDPCTLVGCVFRAGKFLEGVIMRDVSVDGADATDQIISMVNDTRHRDQVQVILLDGVSFGGFNVVDGDKLVEHTGKAVIAVTRKNPSKQNMENALKHVENSEERFQTIQNWGVAKPFEQDNGKIYFQSKNISEENARKVLKYACTRSLIPEPVRVAHMIGSALVQGESTSRP